MLWPIHYEVLSQIARGKFNDLRKINETLRQKAIDLAMHEPPFVDVDADRILVTDAGRTALRKLGNNA